jgi:iron complex transport system substrate-binding protein
MHPGRGLTILLLLATMLTQAGTGASAQGAGPGTPANSMPVTLTGCSGQPLTFDHVPEWIVTLDAYAAEFVIDLGFGDRIVGTGYPYPDAQIPDDLRDDYAAIPVLADLVPSREAIAAAQPDLVLTAYSALFGIDEGFVDPDDVRALGAVPFASCWDAATTTVSDIEFTYAFFDELGQILRVPDRAEGIVAGLRERQASIVERYAGESPTRVFADATDPNDGQPIPTWGGASLPNGIMTLAGCTNIFGDVDDDGVVPSAEEVAARDPEVLIIVSDFSTLTSEELIAAIQANNVLSGTTAARDGRFVVVSHVLVGGPSPRNLDAVEALAAACHPTS